MVLSAGFHVGFGWIWLDLVWFPSLLSVVCPYIAGNRKSEGIFMGSTERVQCTLHCVLYSVILCTCGMSSTVSVWCRSMHSIVEYINKESTNRPLLESK